MNMPPCDVTLSVRHPLTDCFLMGNSAAQTIVGTSFVPVTRPGTRQVSRCDFPFLDYASSIIRAYLDGKCRQLDTVPLDYSTGTAFQQKILDAARKIAYGTCITYSQLAHLGGHPAAVRAAASVMRNNPLPLFIPCHRVVAKNGFGGFMGATTGPLLLLKHKLQELERNTAPLV